MAPWVGVLLAKSSTDPEVTLIHSRASLTCDEEVRDVAVPGNDTSIVLTPVSIQGSQKLAEEARTWPVRVKCTLTLPTGRGYLNLYRVIMGLDKGAVVMAQLPAGIKLVFPRNEGSSSERSFFGWLGIPNQAANGPGGDVAMPITENASLPLENPSGGAASLSYSRPARTPSPSMPILVPNLPSTPRMIQKRGQGDQENSVTSDFYKISVSSSPGSTISSTRQYLSFRILLPRSSRMHFMVKIAAVNSVLNPVFHLAKDTVEHTPLYVTGFPHVVREGLVIIFKEAIQFFRVPTEEMRLLVQFKWYQMETQDVCSFAQVAGRSGCVYYSDPTEEVATFYGNIYNIQAALSYMVHY